MDTSQMIIEKVAPLFNRKGYVATSMSDITKEINLTKGAIYCNFKNKEELALKAFEYTFNKVMGPINKKIVSEKSCKSKLYSLVEYYRDYYAVSKKMGGCPVLRVGNDAKYNNPKLYKRVTQLTSELVSGIEKIIENGKKFNEIKDSVNSEKVAFNIYSMIQGAVFMTNTHDDENYIIYCLDYIQDKLLPDIFK